MPQEHVAHTLLSLKEMSDSLKALMHGERRKSKEVEKKLMTTKIFYKPRFGLYKPKFELHKPRLELYKPNLGL